ncbi:CPBP family intramembrane glutamic endopeptidase [Pelagibius sp. Alg239-R121]|uniref:CPBP family intramembrane glutamic endopeptidase n=1 Tax=Pelagibius sp. Alg239-R121 TaxID=2993448 RepID=UPI0024A7230B|nr:CPBP family intramembrane glutamic endopeptidase [Pelagibius sp. Alg239-R121]
MPAYDLVAVLIISLLGQRLLPFAFFNTPDSDQLAGAAPSPPTVTDSMLFLTVHSLLVMASIYFIVIRRRGLRLSDLGIVLVSKTWIVRAAVAGIATVFISGLVIQVLRTMQEEPFHNPQIDIFVGGGPSFSNLLISLLVTGAIVPLTEEIAFRGLFYGWLRQHMSVAASVAISSAFFAFLHGVPFLIPIFALVGAILAFITEKSGSVLAATITHGVFNAFGVISLYTLMYRGAFEQAAG